jgi:hypothetical protein
MRDAINEFFASADRVVICKWYTLRLFIYRDRVLLRPGFFLDILNKWAALHGHLLGWADLLEPRHDVILTREQVKEALLRLQSLINQAREEGQVTIDMPFKETAALRGTPVIRNDS